MDTHQQYSNNNLASLDKRLISQFLDAIISYALFFAFFYGFKDHIGDVTSVYIAASLSLAYFLFSDSFPGGQSLGKKITKIKVVVKGTDRPCSIIRSFLRNITFPLSLIDWVSIFFSSRRRLGDYIAFTEVKNTNR